MLVIMRLEMREGGISMKDRVIECPAVFMYVKKKLFMYVVVNVKAASFRGSGGQDRKDID